MSILNDKRAATLAVCYALSSLIIAGNVMARETIFEATDLEGYLRWVQVENPDLMAYKAQYEAAVQRIPLSATLPDPMLQVTHFVESVQTRTGPQEKNHKINAYNY